MKNFYLLGFIFVLVSCSSMPRNELSPRKPSSGENEDWDIFKSQNQSAFDRLRPKTEVADPQDNQVLPPDHTLPNKKLNLNKKRIGLSKTKQNQIPDQEDSFSAMASAYPVTNKPGYGENTRSVIGYTQSLEGWKYRAEAVRRGLIKGSEFWDKTKQELTDHGLSNWPLNPIISLQVTTADYEIYGVRFESTPGFYVTGNLYVPKNLSAPLPGIVVPHGHFGKWGGYARLLEENQILCAQLARMGGVVFTYDMIGWGDAQQLDHPDSYGWFGGANKKFKNGTPNNLLALQFWNNIRSLDFLVSLTQAQFSETDSDKRKSSEDALVDSSRIGVTGASGGATQSLYLAAADPRVSTASLVVMITAGFTGDDYCEDGMPVRKVPWWPDDYAVGQFMRNSNNTEIAATLAPKPVLVISDGDDWTKNFPNDDYPYMKKVWNLFEGADCEKCSDRAINVHLKNEGHDYGPSKRMATYRFLNIGLNLPRFSSVASISGNSLSFIASQNLVTAKNPEGVEVQNPELLKVGPMSSLSFKHWCPVGYSDNTGYCLSRPWDTVGHKP